MKGSRESARSSGASRPATALCGAGLVDRSDRKEAQVANEMLDLDQVRCSFYGVGYDRSVDLIRIVVDLGSRAPRSWPNLPGGTASSCFNSSIGFTLRAT
jgi:hypothetical protein